MRVRIAQSTDVGGVRAGSALLAVEGSLLVIGDDAFRLTRIGPDGAVSHTALAGSGAPLPKPLKPDFEAAARAPDGSIWVFGSGSTSARWQLVHLSGTDHRHVRAYDGAPLYSALEALLGTAPNIEGAVFRAGRLLLLHRSTGHSDDLLIDLAAHGLDSGHEVHPTVRARISPPDLAGIPAHATDLASTADGRLVVLAAAEDTLDPVLDGPVAGTALGVLEGEDVRWSPILEADGSPCVRKAEGLVLDIDLRGGWAVTDRDDPEQPAELLRLEITGL